jgi:hypothetical protein
MKNKKVKQFEAKVAELVVKEKERINNLVAEYLKQFCFIELKVFNTKDPYKGELNNKIFFAYCDHYYANSGLNMQVGELVRPNSLIEDRGYLKGVATDLRGYLLLRSANSLNSNLCTTKSIYYPKFNQSKNSHIYYTKCDEIVNYALKEMDNFVLEAKNTMNTRLKDLTNMSLLYYVRNI